MASPRVDLCEYTQWQDWAAIHARAQLDWGLNKPRPISWVESLCRLANV